MGNVVLSVTTGIGLCWCGWLITYPVLFWLLFTEYFWIPLLVFGWMLLDDTQNHGGRSWRPLQNSSITSQWCSHFPVSLHITAAEQITPANNYIFACHPHGIFGAGITCALVTDGLQIAKRLPGMRFTPLVSRAVFAFPLFREVFLWMGCANASQRNMEYIARCGTGNVMLLVPGGAAEICLLVPVFSFGETSVFDQPFYAAVGSRLRRFQRWFTSLTGFPMVLVHGPSKIVFWRPYKRPIHVVVGRPIAVGKVSQPTQKEIDDLHANYKLALNDLFNSCKSVYGFDKAQLKFS
ncbi:acyl-CoA wax alcohol acyltransferase 1-like isoform X2 [Paramacrobiotus metropolitanus]|uniref:acyl-CoA wax alcohol acyltransferase 1-like isoform X2 n=1 Tax=Paramacrobiotus metropolitanus TaxID=2943436 RepID=UPI0024456891|nr:acyl-CoA wax alcohol acyltransferase 1-like isoform X2 [Paramacrobiotus metropolitanus]